jgi:hypothetical protein
MNNYWTTPDIAHLIDWEGLDDIKSRIPVFKKTRKKKRKRFCIICGQQLSIYNPDWVCFSHSEHSKPYRAVLPNK